MTTQAVEKELIELEKQYWQAIKNKDVDAAMRLTDDTCIVAGAQGVASIDRNAFAGMMQSGDWTLDEFEISDDVQVRLISDDVAVVGYKVREKLTVDGKPVTLEAADSSAWTRGNGTWRCALHTESITRDPYGRDRQPMKSRRDMAMGASHKPDDYTTVSPYVIVDGARKRRDLGTGAR